MPNAKTINVEIGYEDDGKIIFVDINKEDIPLVRRALAYLYKQEQEEKQKARKQSSTCRNCQFSHLGMLTLTTIPVDAPGEEIYIRKDLVEHIIREALGPQDALNKIRSLWKRQRRFIFKPMRVKHFRQNGLQYHLGILKIPSISARKLC